MKTKTISKKFIIIYAIVFICIMIGIGIWWWVTKSKLTKTYLENENTISELNEKISEQQNTEATTEEVVAASSTENTEEGSEVLDKASDAGTKIADIQNWYFTNTYETPADEVKERATEAGTYIAEKQDTSVWYYWYYCDINNPDVNPVWSFCTTYSFSGNTVPVLWVCYNQAKDHELLAYAQGTYHADDNMFYDLEYHVTAIGDSYGPGSEGYGAVNDYDNETTEPSDDAESTDASENESVTETIE